MSEDLLISLHTLLDWFTEQDTIPEHKKVDLLVLLGNDDVEMIQEAANQIKEKDIGKVLVVGGVGRLAPPLLAHETVGKLMHRDFDPVVVEKVKKAMDSYTEDSDLDSLREKLCRLKISESTLMRDLLVHTFGAGRHDMELEKCSTNNLENVRLGYKRLEALDWNKDIRSILLMQKPIHQKRAMRTFLKQWMVQKWEMPGILDVYSLAAYKLRTEETEKKEMRSYAEQGRDEFLRFITYGDEHVIGYPGAKGHLCVEKEELPWVPYRTVDRFLNTPPKSAELRDTWTFVDQYIRKTCKDSMPN